MADEDAILDEGTEGVEDSDDTGSNDAPFEGIDDSDGSAADGELDSPPALSHEVLQRAESYGLGADDVAGFDADRLERMFAGIDRKVMGGKADTLHNPVAPARRTETTKPFQPFEIKLDEYVDESISGPINGIVEHLNSQMKEVYHQRGAMQKELHAMNTIREIGGFDRYIESLGDEWSEQYGKGPTLEMDPQSDAFLKRLEVYTGAEGLRGNQSRRGGKMRNGDSWERSHRATHWDRITELARKSVGNKVSDRKRQLSERPTKGKTPGMTPREEAIIAATR